MRNARSAGTVLALSLLLFVATGCGGDDGGSSSTPASTAVETSTTTSESAGIAPDSTSAAPEESESPPTPTGRSAEDEDVPLPPGARPSQGAAYEYVNAWEVPGSDFASVVDFYDDQMPEGQDWEDWAWCDTGTTDDANPSRTYSRGTEILSVTIIEREPPTIMMGISDSGPC